MRETDLDALEASDVVANARMNRNRGLVGLNSYEKELGFNPLSVLEPKGPNAAWLDICCGAGVALAYASSQVPQSVELVGVDLVEQFVRFGRVRFVACPVRLFEPTRAFDLITCVHGLHYCGDKLDVIKRAASWLTEDGLFVANVDKNNIQGIPPKVLFKQPGMSFVGRTHRLTVTGKHDYTFPYRFVGYEHSGPNYTMQDAIDSVYEKG